MPNIFNEMSNGGVSVSSISIVRTINVGFRCLHDKKIASSHGQFVLSSQNGSFRGGRRGGHLLLLLQFVNTTCPIKSKQQIMLLSSLLAYFH